MRVGRLFGAAAVLAAAPAWAGDARFSAEAIDKGREQYNRVCVQCHGRNMINAGTTVFDLRRFPTDQADRFKQSVLKNLTSKSVKIYCFHKADTDNLIVSAASIIAKVTRDREIKKIEETLCKKIGSGYPSDPSTRLFLRNHLFDNENKKYIRFSWSPVKNMINEGAQTKLF